MESARGEFVALLEGDDCCLLAKDSGIDIIRLRMSMYQVNDRSSWVSLPFEQRRFDHLR